MKTGPEPVDRLPAGTAQRPEPAARRPGPLAQGTLALTEFEVEAAPGRRPEKTDEGQDRQGDGRRESGRRRCSNRSSTTRAASSRVTGPIEFAIDGKDETAWGIDVGPGRRNQPRKAVFSSQKPVSFPARHDSARSS